MDGVFMRKIIKLIFCVFLVISLLSALDLWQDRQILQDKLIRLHIVANSDSLEDQQIKLKVKDAITEYLQPFADQLPTKEQAMNFLRENLTNIQALANDVLNQLGVADQATASLKQEKFDARNYDTFSLPSGIYDSLRIEIGDADGKNWWCVVFPSLCLPTTSAQFQDTAVSAGFSQELTNTVSNNCGYKIRFFLLDCIGKLENLFY